MRTISLIIGIIVLLSLPAVLENKPEIDTREIHYNKSKQNIMIRPYTYADSHPQEYKWILTTDANGDYCIIPAPRQTTITINNYYGRKK
jgi:hypothetical protein